MVIDSFELGETAVDVGAVEEVVEAVVGAFSPLTSALTEQQL
jgi:hypothetical protein